MDSSAGVYYMLTAGLVQRFRSILLCECNVALYINKLRFGAVQGYIWVFWSQLKMYGCAKSVTNGNSAQQQQQQQQTTVDTLESVKLCQVLSEMKKRSSKWTEL